MKTPWKRVHPMAISQRDLSGKEEEEKDNHYDQDR
jgi:hypothetical protein